MKRILSLAVLVAIAAMLVMPATAMSAPKGNGNGGGKGRSAARTTSGASHGNSSKKIADPGALVTDEDTPVDKKDAKAAEKAERKDAKAAEKEQRSEAKQERVRTESESETPDGDEAGEAVEASESADASLSADAPTKLTGIANALSHIQANLARMQERVDAGLRKSLPQGLLAVVDKFMGWLGMTPELPTAGGETTGTVVPTDTVTPTDTVIPTDTITPTDTVVPTSTPDASETAALVD